ncbi:thialysine N-epsilon-acetyltransferase-like [Diadema antillarum]|uniref:thialysine N-epsilon-acetyltransferase-like n=1 Tax=Diadema antillarum TaxID=105358 RepID=UPI003A848C20
MVYYIIRKGRPEDCSDLYRLIRETAEFSSQKQHPSSDDRDMTVDTTEDILRRDAFTDPPRFSFLVVECYFTQEQMESKNGEIVGFSTFNEMYSIYKGRSAFMSGMFVTSSHRGNNLAPTLFRTTSKICLDSGCNSLMWGVSRWNFGGKTFYQKLGAVNATDREQREFMTLNRDHMEKLSNKYRGSTSGGVEIYIEGETDLAQLGNDLHRRKEETSD